GMAPGIGSAAGSTVYGAFLDDRMAVFAVTYQPGGGYMATSGEVGYTYGTMRAPESNFNTSYLRFWRFIHAGEWKIAVEVLNPFLSVLSSASPDHNTAVSEFLYFSRYSPDPDRQFHRA